MNETYWRNLVLERAKKWKLQQPAGLWAARSTFIPDSHPIIVWRMPSSNEVEADTTTSFPSWEALYHWMNGYQHGREGKSA